MHRDTTREAVPEGLLRIEDCLDDAGEIVLPPGVTLISLIERNIAHVGDTVAYRFLDYSGGDDAHTVEMTWKQLGVRMQAIGAHLQQVAGRGDRVAILAPQGLEYVAGFFAAAKAGTIAVPLFAPELPGHAERLDVALRDSRPAAVLTTAAARGPVEDFLAAMGDAERPAVVVIDDVADSAARDFAPVIIDVDDVSHLQYTGGATRPPVGVEITHRAVGTNLLQMILSIDLLDRNTHGVSWLPLYHDMGLSMIGFPAVYGGHSTLMSPTAFIRRPLRWIEALSAAARSGRVVTAAPNFAYEWAARRGVPDPDAGVDLRDVVLIVGSEPVSIDAINAFNAAFALFGLPGTAFKPSYGLAEATLFVSTIAPDAEVTVRYVDRQQLIEGRAMPVRPDHERAVAQVSCGQVARSQRCVIVDGDGIERPDGVVGEIWLHGDNVGRGYWGLPQQTAATFGARLAGTQPDGSHALGVGVDENWLRTGDLGFYLDGELYVSGRIADQLFVDGLSHYPQHIEATAADASPVVRRGYVTAFTVDGDVVVVAERAAGTAHVDTAQAVEAVRSAVRRRHGLPVADVRVVPAGAIPRTTSGKLARRACRAEYLGGGFG
ncbi:fatty acyl-AMP ligase [Mycobacterium sp. 4D054]|uniref:fatty acyl-AMP ligase n=1 Tax=Mycobacterium sp. 4D054 TaxID=3457440 RepID=UPI003FD2A8D0